MKSIRSEVCDNLPGAIECYYLWLEAYPDSPEAELEHQEREAWAKKVVETTFDHFSDDDHVLAIIIGKSEGRKGDEIRTQEGMTRKQYDAALKRLSRYRNINYPRGSRNE